MTDENDAEQAPPPGGLVRGGLYLGSVAYVVGMVASFFLVFVSMADAVFQETDAALTVTGWFFYNAHFVPLSMEGSAVNALQLFDRGFPPAFYVAIPLATLSGLGSLHAGWMAERRSLALVDAARYGACLALGYAVWMAVGALLLTASFGGGQAGPDLVRSIVQGGVAYPVVVGGVGAIVGHVHRRRRTADPQSV